VRVAVVVPTYQEVENIEPFLRSVRATLPDARIVVCDDNSPDGTGKVAEEVGQELGDVEVLHRPGKAGLGAAYRHGFRVALDEGADVVIQMDVDFSHPHDMLPGMVAAVESGAPDWSLHRKLLSHWGNLYARWMLRLAVRDSTSGFRAYRAGSLERIRFDGTRANGYGFQIETAYRLGASGAKVVEHPLVFVDRVHGSSKMSVAIMIENTLLVTWWGICMRAPRLTRRFRDTSAGRQLEAWHARTVRGA
jgi:dolichol-phosphate mannosyltransferase